VDKIIILIFFVFVTGAIHAQQPDVARQYTPRDFPTATSSSPNVKLLNMKEYVGQKNVANGEVEVHKNVVYVNRDGVDLHLHILYPKGTVSSLPCIVYVQGSAWKKQNLEMAIPDLARVAAKGFVVASVEYRPSDIGKFPSQVQDAKTAIRFMRKHAEQYFVDTHNIVIWGNSSGGHTAMFVGFTQGNKTLDTDVYSEYSDKVNAVVNFFGPSELAKMSDFPSTMNHALDTSPEGILIGGSISENPELARRASPVYYVTKDAVPVFMAHGDRDMLVPLNQSDLVAEALDKAGVAYEYYCLQGAGHGGREFWTNEMLEKMIEFIKKHR
jgi:acetyl esterase/lipase